MEMKVLVVRQPSAWQIVNGYKDIENRDWSCRYRGLILIQASAALPSKADMAEFRQEARRRGVTRMPEQFETGGIVGLAYLDDCVTRSRSKWFKGSFGWQLSKPRPLRLIPMKGRLRLFDVPPAVRLRVMRQLREAR
jgi:hypothetical protein